MTSTRQLFLVLLVAATMAAAIPAAAAPPASPTTAPSPSATADVYRPRIKPYSEDIGAVFSVLWSSLLGVALCVSAWLLVKEWRRNPLVIEPLDVPQDVQNIGLTGTVLSQQLSDAILELQRNARPDDGPADIAFVELPRLQVDLQLPGMSWSVRGAIRYFKQAVGKTERRLVGEVLKSGRAYRLRLRSSGGRAVDVPVRFHNTSDLPAALAAGAEAAVTLTDPLEGASIFYSMETPRTGYARTLAAIRLQLTTGPAGTHEDAYVLWASVCRALGDTPGMESRLALARAAGSSRWMGRPRRRRPRYLNFTGNLLRERGQFDEAEKTFRAVHRYRRNVGAMTNLGLLYLDMDQPAKARSWFRRLIRMRPTSSRGYRGLGLLAGREGDWASSLHWLTRSVDVGPRARWPRVNRIEALRVIGDLDAADADAQAFLQDDPGFGPLYRFCSRIAADREDLATALKWAKHATEVDRTDAWAFIEVARVAARMGLLDDALAAADRAQALRPSLAEAYRCRATALAAQDQIDAAVSALREGSDANPTDLWCLLELSDLHRRRGLQEAALEACTAALQRRPFDANALRYSSWVTRDRGDLWGAEVKLREAVVSSPFNTVVQLDLAENLRSQRRFDESIVVAEQVLRQRVRPGFAHVQIARTLRSQCQTEAAERRLRLAIQDAPSEVSPRHELVDLLRQQERYDEALRVLEDAASRFPCVTAITRRWAWILSERGDPSGAAAKFEQAFAAAPYDVDNLIEAADFYRQRGALADAAARANQAVARRPDWAASWRCQARVLRDLGDRAAAEQALRKAVALVPGDIWARADLCSMLRGWRQWPDAVVVARELVRERPDSPEGRLQWAWTCDKAGDVLTADEQFQAALAAAPPHDVRPRLYYADFLIARKRADEAIAQAQQALQTDPLSLDALRRLVNARAAADDVSGAIEIVDRWASIAPAEIEPFMLLADLHQRAERPREALTALETALQRRPTSLRVRRKMLQIQIDEASWEEAERVLDALCEQAPAEVEDLVVWAKALEERDPTLALSQAALQRALDRQPQSAPVLRSRARLLARLGDAPGAEQALRQAIAAAPWDDSPRMELADRLWDARRRPEALQVLQAASAFMPRSPTLLRRLAELLLEDGQLIPGAEVLARLREATPATDPWALVTLADCLEKYGKRKDAVDVAKRAIERVPADAAVLRYAASIFERTGDRPAAICHLRAATDLDPADDFIATELARVLCDAGDREAARTIAMTVLARSPKNSSARRLIEKIGAPPA